MKRTGRILIVDDEERWLNVLSNTLTRGGFHTDAVTTTAQALQKMDSTFYHMAVLDIRMESGDQDNAEGMALLDKMQGDGLLGSMAVLMLSAYGTKEQMREAFAKHRVTDFLSKEQFNNEEFIKQIDKIFADEIRVNLDLEINWQKVAGPEQVVLNLEVDGVRVKRDSPLQTRIAAELEDLLSRLFNGAQSILIAPLAHGHSGSAVLLATPFYEAGAGQPVVVKFGDFRNIDKEYKNFKEYVQNFIGGRHSTNILELRRTSHLGGIIYSLLGRASDRLESFGHLYSCTDISEINEVLDRTFLETCGEWYANPGRLLPFDLTAEYVNTLRLMPEVLQYALTDRLKSHVQGKEELYFKDLGNQRAFTNPVLVAANHRFIKPTYICTTHGDFNESNILVDDTRHTWLIDFFFTGPGHILRDVAKLDSVVRFQLLGQDEATLAERLEMEVSLCSVTQFGQVTRLANSFQTENKALLKAYGVTAHLRALAYKLVSQNPNNDIAEYYVALFYYALNTLKFYSLSALQRQHALLSASLLSDHLMVS